MLLGTNPNMSVTPLAQFPQFLYFFMRVLHVVLDGEPRGIEHAHVAAKSE